MYITTRRHVAAVASIGIALWTLDLAAQMSNGELQRLPGGAWDYSQYHPDTTVSQLDNPRVIVEVPLYGDESAAFVPRSGGTFGVNYLGFRLDATQTCETSPQNFFCGEGDRKDFFPMAALGNNFVPLGGAATGSNSLFELAGLALGHDYSRITFVKEDGGRVTTNLGAIDLRLDAETIVVPVNVVLEKTMTQSPVVNGVVNVEYYLELVRFFAREARPELWQAFIDDATALGAPETVTAPGGGFSQHVRSNIIDPHAGMLQDSWTMVENMVRLDDNHTERRPDTVFAQCGIQFRLASVVVLVSEEPLMPASGDPKDVNPRLRRVYQDSLDAIEFPTEDELAQQQAIADALNSLGYFDVDATPPSVFQTPEATAYVRWGEWVPDVPIIVSAARISDDPYGMSFSRVAAFARVKFPRCRGQSRLFSVHAAKSAARCSKWFGLT